jgi:tRNA G18 (ribose-2'-O)-methylase SpoU
LQLNHSNTNFKKKSFQVILIAEDVSNAPNIGSLFRISDAFGIEKLIFCGETISFGRKLTKTSRATEKVVAYSFYDSAFEAVISLKNRGYQIISLEITNNSKALHTFKFSKEKPIALIIGDENFGISESVLNASDDVIHIDMYGQNSSMNVVQAANIALYEITKQLL